MSLQGLIICHMNKEKIGCPGKPLIKLHAVEKCLEVLGWPEIERFLKLSKQTGATNIGLGFLWAQLAVGGRVVPIQAVN